MIAGHRMRADEALTQTKLSCERDDPRFGAADIGNESSAPEIRRGAAQDVECLVDRHGDDDEIGGRESLERVAQALVHDPVTRRRGECVASASNALTIMPSAVRSRATDPPIKPSPTTAACLNGSDVTCLPERGATCRRSARRSRAPARRAARLRGRFRSRDE